MEIKFRAKDADTGKWRYGYYVLHEKVTPCVIGEADKEDNEEHLLIFDGFSDWNLPKPWYKCNINPDTLGQYTNVKDSKKVEVYAGDILIDERGRYWIVYAAPGGFCVCRTTEWIETCGHPIMTSGLSELQNVAWTEQSCTVVGNIYDNPELIEVNNNEI
jgi:uncharacterized phage protein (TIGR01671 family)